MSDNNLITVTLQIFTNGKDVRQVILSQEDNGMRRFFVGFDFRVSRFSNICWCDSWLRLLQFCYFILIDCQIHCETTPFTCFAFNLYTPTLKIRELLNEHKPKSGTLMVTIQAAIELHKRLKQPFQILRGNPNPII